MALEVPPSFLFAPIAAPSSSLNLPGLSDAFSEMTALQFDAWLANDTGTAYLPVSSNERYARLELDALRRLTEIDSKTFASEPPSATSLACSISSRPTENESNKR